MDNLISLYKQRLNLQEATFSRIEHADAMVAVVYKLTLPNGMQHILKICPRSEDYHRESYFLKYFAGALPVARIIAIVQPESGIHGAILMECLPGSLLKVTDLTDELAYEIGSILARIHLNRVTGYGDLTQPKNLNPDPRVHFSLKFEEGITECSKQLPKALIEKSRHFFDTHLDLLASVDGPCIIHRDFRHGNVMVQNGKLQGIIDWASGRASFAEDDFCPLEHGEWSTNPTIKKSFLAGYASIRTIPDYTAIMPLLRLSRTIATIGFTVKQGTWEGSNAHLYQVNRHHLEAFFK